MVPWTRAPRGEAPRLFAACAALAGIDEATLELERMIPVRILGTAAALPGRAIPTAVAARCLPGKDPEEIVERGPGSAPATGQSRAR